MKLTYTELLTGQRKTIDFTREWDRMLTDQQYRVDIIDSKAKSLAGWIGEATSEEGKRAAYNYRRNVADTYFEELLRDFHRVRDECVANHHVRDAALAEATD